jgi:inhibitor of Bruton tyrosine kinase
MNHSNQSSGTQFIPRPVQGIGEEVVTIALGQDHTVALTKSGAVWTWGSNQHGQLGYALDISAQKENIQKVPRKISTLKKMEVRGIAASNLHTVCFTDDAFYTWGLNRGQLGYTSSEDEPIQAVPKKVASLPAPVEMVTAIDHATVCLLKTRAVMVFANNGSFRMT